MPIYEYICEACHEELEVIQKISDEPMTVCPSCKQQSLKKKTSMSAFHLKGGGWYKDGYGNSKTDQSDTTKPSSTDAKTDSESKSKADEGSKSSDPPAPESSKTKSPSTDSGTPTSKAS